MNQKLKILLQKVIRFFANPRLLLCLAVAWMITNGWSYVLFALGTWRSIPWMVSVGGAYLAFLWLPVSPEKLATVAIAMALLRWLFPQDQQTLGVLREMGEKLKESIKKKKAGRRDAPAEHKENAYGEE